MADDTGITLYGADGQPVSTNGVLNGGPQVPAPIYREPAYRPTAAPTPSVSTAQVQASDEGAEEGEVDHEGEVLFRVWNPQAGEWGDGRWFRMSDRIGLMPLLRFVHSARGGVEQTDPKALLALYDMIGDCVDQDRPQRIAVDPRTQETLTDPETGQPVLEDAGPSAWDDFQDYATEQKADDEDLMEFVGAVIEVLSSRPKRPRGSSPAGRQPTSGSSRGVSPSPATDPATAGRVPPDMDGLVSVDSLVRGPS